MVKRDTGKKDNKSSRFSFGSVIKYFKTSRGRMMFETGALLAFCTALLVSGGVSLAWYKVNTDVQANAGSVKIEAPVFTEIKLNVHPVTSVSGSNYSYSGDNVSKLPDYDVYALDSNIVPNAVVLEFTTESESAQTVRLSVEASDLNNILSADNSLSNCIDITSAARSGSAAVADSNWKSFIIKNGDSFTKDKTKISFENPMTISKDNPVLLVVRYNEEAISHITNWILDMLLTDTDNIHFASDLSFVFEN